MTIDTRTTNNVKQAVPFFAVSNIEDSVRYYTGGLGFEMTKKWVTSLSDPGGYRIDFESATDVPEETELSEQDAPLP